MFELTRSGVKAIVVMSGVSLMVISPTRATDYGVIDTGQDQCYDTSAEITCPNPGEPYHGQDAQYDGTQPDYTLSGDGLTVHDSNTGLTWQQSPDTDGDGDIDSDDKLTWVEVQSYPDTLNVQSFGGYSDWRVPSIKELYSLIDFRGMDPSGYSGDTSGLVPFIDRSYFAFAFGDESAGERIIDAQYWSSTQYVGTTMGGDSTVFGVNFADGRIKGYPRDTGPGGDPFTQFLRCVRGNSDYGVNGFVDNGDGTITDTATGLMWQQGDDGNGLNWEDALAYAESLTLGGYDDWRLPNAKELQSIVDYTRSPSTTGSPAIDSLLTCTSIIDEAGSTNYPFYWVSTTHENMGGNSGQWAAYVAFGEALGYMGPPGMGNWIDVHGAGAQRSDPKDGNPGDWPYGNGPQGDAVRIYNYVRCVRDDPDTTNSAPHEPHSPHPGDAETSVDVDADLSWSGGDPDLEDTVSYDVYFDTQFPPAQVVWNHHSASYDPGTMDYAVQYYWRIVAWDNHGDSTGGPTWLFTTADSLSGPLFIRADSNTDSIITMADPMHTLRYLYVPGSDPALCLKSADADDDGEVAMSDGIFTLKYLYVPGASLPPAPFPGCGGDPTSDGLDCGSHPCQGEMN